MVTVIITNSTVFYPEESEYILTLPLYLTTTSTFPHLKYLIFTILRSWQLYVINCIFMQFRTK